MRSLNIWSNTEMKNNKLRLALLFFSVAILASCSKAPVGVGKNAVNSIYRNYSFLKTMYTESMIRAATKVADLDSSYALSRNTDYILQFEVKRNTRYYVPKTDSIIQHHLKESGLETFFLMEQPSSTMQVWGRQSDGIIDNVVFIESDTSSYKLYEFVGNMPINTLFNQGVSNFDKLKKTLNLDLFNNAGNDSTNN